MQETEKIKADNQISKNENLVQVWFFNQSLFKTNRKAVNLSPIVEVSFHGPGGPCSPARHTEHRVVQCCRRPAARPRPGHRARAFPATPRYRQLPPPVTAPCCELLLAPGAAGPAGQLPPELGAALQGCPMSLGSCLGPVELNKGEVVG